MMNLSRTTAAIVFVVLVAAAAGSRLLDIAPNFAAVSAAALFAGFLFRSRAAALAVPLVGMLISDAFIGFYHPLLMAAVYASLMAPVFLSRWLGATPGPVRVAVATLGGSAFFFLASNFAVWLGGAYGLTLEGLATCYVAALPFFKYTVGGDLLFATIFFGAWALATMRRGETAALAEA